MKITIKDVAKEANVATSTVSRVLSDSNKISESLNDENYKVCRCTVNKFLEDKICYRDTMCICLIEGIVLNKLELMERYNVNSFSDLIKGMFKSEGETFFNKFRGCYAGAYYDVEEKIWYIYTNHVGDRPIFYYKVCQLFLIFSKIGLSPIYKV